MTKRELAPKILEQITALESQLGSIPDGPERAQIEGLIKQTRAKLEPYTQPSNADYAKGPADPMAGYERQIALEEKKAKALDGQTILPEYEKLRDRRNTLSGALSDEANAVASSALNSVPFVRPLMENTNELANELARGSQTARNVINTVLPAKGSHQQYMSRSNMPAVTGTAGTVGGLIGTLPLQAAKAVQAPEAVGGLAAIAGSPFMVANKIGEAGLKLAGKAMPNSPHLATVVGNTITGAAMPAAEAALENRSPSVEELLMGATMGGGLGLASGLHGKATDPRTVSGRDARDYEAGFTVPNEPGVVNREPRTLREKVSGALGRRSGDDVAPFRDPEFRKQGDSTLQAEELAKQKAALAEETTGIKSEMEPQISGVDDVVSSRLQQHADASETASQAKAMQDKIDMENMSFEESNKLTALKDRAKQIEQSRKRKLAEIKAKREVQAKGELSTAEEEARAETGRMAEEGAKRAGGIGAEVKGKSDVEYKNAEEEVIGNPEIYGKEIDVPPVILNMLRKAKDTSVSTGQIINPRAAAAAEQIEKVLIKRKGKRNGKRLVTTPVDIMKVFFDVRESDATDWGRFVGPMKEAVEQAVPPIAAASKRMKTTRDALEREFDILSGKLSPEMETRAGTETKIAKRLATIGEKSAQEEYTPGQIEELKSGILSPVVEEASAAKAKEAARIAEARRKAEESMSAVEGRVRSIEDRTSRNYKNIERTRSEESARKLLEEKHARERKRQEESRTQEEGKRAIREEGKATKGRLTASMEERLASANASAKERMAKTERIKRLKEVQEGAGFTLPRAAKSNTLNEIFTMAHQFGKMGRTRTARYLDDYSGATPYVSDIMSKDTGTSDEVSETVAGIPQSLASKYQTAAKWLSTKDSNEVKKLLDSLEEKLGSLDAAMKTIEETVKEGK